MKINDGIGYSFACSEVKFGDVAFKRYSSASLPFQTALAGKFSALINLRAICWLTGLSARRQSALNG